MLKLYGFARVNKIAHGNTRDLRVLWALEEMEIPFEIAGIDHPNHELDTATYRAMNPFGQIPAIDDDGVIVTESAAILIYLARKSGRLIPKDLAGEAQVLRWSFAAMNSVELPLLTLQFAGWVDKSETSPLKTALAKWAEQRLANLDRWLDGRTWVATDDFTVADILMSHVIGPEAKPEMLAKHERVRAYVERCKARPAWQRDRRLLRARCRRLTCGRALRIALGLDVRGAGTRVALSRDMKTVLWLAAAAGALAASALALSAFKKRGLAQRELALASGPIDLDQTQVIEIVPLDVSGPLFLDPVTEALLERLADEALFLK